MVFNSYITMYEMMSDDGKSIYIIVFCKSQVQFLACTCCWPFFYYAAVSENVVIAINMQ